MKIITASRIEHITEYYFSRKMKEIEGLNKNGRQVINLGIGSPDLAPESTVVNSLLKSAQDVNNHAYQNYKGIPDLRIAIAKWYKNIYNITVNANNEVLPLIGSKEGIMHISMAYINKGDEVLIPNPGYPAYRSATKIAGGKIIDYNLSQTNDWNICLKEIESLISRKTKLIWINYPNMPTGAKGNWETLKMLVELAKEHSFLICNDNPYSLTLNEDPRSMLALDPKKEVLMELNSLSKSHNMAGWRLGMLIANKTRIKEVLTFKSNMDSGMFLPLQHAAISALSLNKAWYKKNNLIYKERRNLMTQLLDVLGCEYSNNTVGMFIWARIPKHYSSAEDFSNDLLNKYRIFITPGNIFGSNGDQYIRVSLCSPVKKINEAINRIK